MTNGLTQPCSAGKHRRVETHGSASSISGWYSSAITYSSRRNKFTQRLFLVLSFTPMKRLLLTSATLALFQQSTLAQPNNDSARRQKGIAFSVDFLFSPIDFTEFNDKVRAAGLPEMPAGAKLLGVGTVSFGNYHQKFFADMAFSGQASQKENGNVTLAYQIGLLDFNFNAVVYQKGRHFVIPSLGFGFGGFTARYTQKNINANFTQAINTFSGERSFETTTNYYINPKLAYHYALSKRGNFLLGAKAGCRIGVNKGRWNIPLQDNDTEGAPMSSANGLFAGLALTATF